MQRTQELEKENKELRDELKEEEEDDDDENECESKEEKNVEHKNVEQPGEYPKHRANIFGHEKNRK